MKRLTRRQLIGQSAALSLLPAFGPLADAASPKPEYAHPLFTLGVASGDPLPHGVVIWTRLAPDPLNGGDFLRVPDTRDFGPFVDRLRGCPKTGLHNPWKNPQRYVMLGQVCARAAALLAEDPVEEYFTRLIQRVMPKSWQQCRNEVTVTRVFLENFAGDGVRFLARGFSNPGDRPGQESRGYRWPYGPVVVIAPFHFPLERPALQALGALFMGNQPLVKVDSKVSAVFEQFLRLLIHAGLPATDLDGVLKVAESIRHHVEHAQFWFDNQRVPVTVSLGVYVGIPAPQANAEKLMHKADEALYQAKRNGRNRVEIYKAALESVKA